MSEQNLPSRYWEPGCEEPATELPPEEWLDDEPLPFE